MGLCKTSPEGQGLRSLFLAIESKTCHTGIWETDAVSVVETSPLPSQVFMITGNFSANNVCVGNSVWLLVLGSEGLTNPMIGLRPRSNAVSR